LAWSAAAVSAWRSIPALSNLYWDQAGLMLIVIFAVVIIIEIVTAWIRGEESFDRAGARPAPGPGPTGRRDRRPMTGSAPPDEWLRAARPMP